MTIATSTNKVNLVTNGVTVSFPFSFKVTDDAHLKVYLDDVLESSGFTINRNPDQDVAAGGTVDYTIPPPAGILTLLRDVPILQDVDYTPYDAFPAETHEGALDELTMICQQIDELLNRGLVAPASEDVAAGGLVIPNDTDRAEKFLAF